MNKILVIDDSNTDCVLLKRYLTKKGYDVSTSLSGKAGIQLFEKEDFDIVMSDFRLPDMDGLEVLKKVKRLSAETPVIVITGYSDVRMAVQVMKRGAFEYVTKPIHPEEILITVKKALASADHNNSKPKEDVTKKSHNTTKSKSAVDFVLGTGLRAKSLNKLVNLVAPTDMTVIITGESGTGKEVTARNIHNQSLRKDKPIVAVDCGALPEELAGSMLFGHKKGSFTGALDDKIGHFEAANNGTLFLDEIGNLSYENQVKLLRVLQERKIQRIGESNDRKIDVRVIAATNDDLKQLVKKGSFREDLYYRLNEFSIELPSLKERKDDLKEFCEYFLKQSSEELGKNVSSIDSAVYNIFDSYDWPGNIRELKNVIKRAVLMCESDRITLDYIPKEIATSRNNGSPIKTNFAKGEKVDLKKIAEEAEKQAIIEVLWSNGFNKTRAASQLNIDRKTLYNKIKSYGIDIPS